MVVIGIGGASSLRHALARSTAKEGVRAGYTRRMDEARDPDFDAGDPPSGEALRGRRSTVIENPADASPEDHHVRRLLQHTIDVPVLASAVEAQDPADAADTLETLDGGEAAGVLEEMEIANAAEALSHMVGPLAVSVLEDLVRDDPGYAAALIEAMPTDDAADLLQLSPDPVGEAILPRMSEAGRSVLRHLLAYDEAWALGELLGSVLCGFTSPTDR